MYDFSHQILKRCVFSIHHSVFLCEGKPFKKAHLMKPEVVLYEVINFIIKSEPCLCYELCN